MRANGRAAVTRRFSQGNTFSSHQRATSGNDSRRSVSPVGAQSTTITSNSPRLVVALQLQQREDLVHARAARSAPRRGSGRRPGRTSSPPSQRWTACQLRSISASAWTSCAQRLSATGTGAARAPSRGSRTGCAPGRSTARRCAARCARCERGRRGDAGLADPALARVEDRAGGHRRAILRRRALRSAAGHHAHVARHAARVAREVARRERVVVGALPLAPGRDPADVAIAARERRAGREVRAPDRRARRCPPARSSTAGSGSARPCRRRRETGPRGGDRASGPPSGTREVVGAVQ